MKAFLYRVCAIFFSHFVLYPDYRISFFIPLAFRFADYTLKGKVILVNFFATWCPPCQKELAAVLQTLWPKYKDNKDFVLLVIGREHSDADLQKYNEKKGFDFPLYPDKDRAIFGAFAKSVIPRGYLVGKDGKIIYTSKGYTDEEFAELMTKIEGALK